MGTHDNTWQPKGFAQLEGAFKGYDFLKALDFDEHFLTVSIVYDNIFQGY